VDPNESASFLSSLFETVCRSRFLNAAILFKVFSLFFLSFSSFLHWHTRSRKIFFQMKRSFSVNWLMKWLSIIFSGRILSKQSDTSQSAKRNTSKSFKIDKQRNPNFGKSPCSLILAHSYTLALFQHPQTSKFFFFLKHSRPPKGPKYNPSLPKHHRTAHRRRKRTLFSSET